MRLVRIPEDRVSVLIGKDGETLERIQELLNVDISVKENDAEIDSEDPMEELRAQNIVKAIGRGFPPEKAFRLLEDNSGLAVINIKNYASTDNSKRRLKGLVIGRDGETRRQFENMTDTEIAVYGKTVAILGPLANVEVAKKAVEMLLETGSHSAAYKYLENNLNAIV
ncbi:MAG: KH domain-containing protein [Candidatus Nanohaloarchaea archaeon]|nr:KH domain-containing protein [Candidatus Nanohaloarchaea archaeon]